MAQWLGGAAELRTLGLACCGLGARAACTVLAVAPALHRLDLAHNDLVPDDAALLATQIQSMRNLRRVNLAGPRLPVDVLARAWVGVAAGGGNEGRITAGGVGELLLDTAQRPAEGPAAAAPAQQPEAAPAASEVEAMVEGVDFGVGWSDEDLY